MNKELDTQKVIRSGAAEYLMYVASTGESDASIEVRYEDENIWLTQKMMALLYDVSLPTINEHIKRIYEDRELVPEGTIRKFRIVQNEGERQISRGINHYGLQMVIAVGFKVNSERAVQFRKWVNQIAMSYTIKGWAMDDERLKRGTYLTDTYFEEQLERIREIGQVSGSFIRRSPIFTQLRLIMTGMPRQRVGFMQRYRIKCIMPCMDIQQQNLLWSVRIIQSRIWDLRMAGWTGWQNQAV